jgi:hypothetical protein
MPWAKIFDFKPESMGIWVVREKREDSSQTDFAQVKTIFF